MLGLRSTRTITGLIETMVWVMMRGVNVDGMAKALEAERSIDHQPFRTTCASHHYPRNWYHINAPTNAQVRVNEGDP